MTSGRCWNPCSWFPPNEDRSTETTCATSWTRCSTSRTPGASGGSCPRSLVPGPEFGPSFAGGCATERGHGSSLRCTPRRVRLSVERSPVHRWWSSTPTSHEGPRTVASLFTTRAAPMVEPMAPSASSAWTSLGCRSACESSPQRKRQSLRALRFSPQPDPSRICTAKRAGRADRHPHNHHEDVMRALGRNRALRRFIVWDVGR